MSADTLTLGGFVFQDFEVPDRIPFGGEQLANVHKLIGGQRIVDTLGRDDKALVWSGRFTGPNAIDRARQVDAMRIAGAAVALTWGALSYSVWIKDFSPEYEASFLIPYTITCEVISDQAAPTTGAVSPSLDDQMSGDSSTASAMGVTIGDPALNGALSSLGSAVASVGSSS